MSDITGTTDEWTAYFGRQRDRLRAHLIDVADALDGCLGVLDILATANAPSGSLAWDELLAAQPTEADRADLAAKFHRATTDVLPEDYYQ